MLASVTVRRHFVWMRCEAETYKRSVLDTCFASQQVIAKVKRAAVVDGDEVESTSSNDAYSLAAFMEVRARCVPQSRCEPRLCLSPLSLTILPFIQRCTGTARGGVSERRLFRRRRTCAAGGVRLRRARRLDFSPGRRRDSRNATARQRHQLGDVYA